MNASKKSVEDLDPGTSGNLLTFCKSAADSLRLDILRALSVESFGVSELANIFDVPQPGMSHHLKILTAGGLLVARREGNSIFYRRALVDAGSPLGELQAELYLAIDKTVLPDLIAERIAGVHQERADHSRVFFEKNADRFRENQELIASFSQFSGSVEDLIRNEKIRKDSVVMEVGPGEGELLLLLSEMFDRVVALDNSPEMLARARTAASDHGSTNIEFLEGELSRAVAHNVTADLLILNMVLHHVASPASVFYEASKLLSPHGRLVIIDLCPHDQDWVRDSCGDLWLGFLPDDLATWAMNCEMTRGQSVYLALRNGFQIQMQIFHGAGEASHQLHNAHS